MSSTRAASLSLTGNNEQGLFDGEGLAVRSATTTLTQNILGAGVLALPFALRCAGVVGGLLLLGFVFVLSVASMGVLILLANQLGEFSYKGMATQTLGRRWATAVELWVLFFNLGICISYPILLGDFLAALGDHFGIGTHISKRGCMCAAVVLVCWPLSCAKSLGSLRLMSTVGVLSVFFCAVAVVKRFADRSYEVPGQPAHLDLFELKSFGNCFPILVGAFGAHFNIPALYREVAPGAGSKEWGETGAGKAAFWKMMKVILYALTLSALFYAGVGLVVYATFGSDTKSDFTENFRPNDVWLVMVRCMMTCALCASFPLTLLSARTSTYNLLLKPTGVAEMTTKLRLGLSTVLCAFCLGVAAVAHDIGIVLAYNGSVFGTPVCFLAPPLMYLLLPRTSQHPLWRAASICCVMAGVIFGILGVVVVSTNA